MTPTTTDHQRRAPGRPPRANVAATRSVAVRLTPDERAIVESRAAVAGLSLTEWSRRQLLAALPGKCHFGALHSWLPFSAEHADCQSDVPSQRLYDQSECPKVEHASS